MTQTHCRIGKVTMKNGGAPIYVISSNKFKNTPTVKMLEETLLMARNGEFVSMGFIGVLADGVVATSFPQGAEKQWNVELVAGAEFLKHRIIEGSEKV